MRRRALSAVTALIALGALAPGASATEEWCEEDPAMTIRTPAGNNVVAFLTNKALGTEHVAALRAATESYTVQAVSNALATDVEIQVSIPDDQYASGFATLSTASTQPYGGGTVLDSEPGKSGQVTKLRFRLDVP